MGDTNSIINVTFLGENYSFPGELAQYPVFDSKIVKKVQQTAWLSHCWTFSSFGGCVMFVFYNPFDFLAIPFRFLSVIY